MQNVNGCLYGSKKTSPLNIALNVVIVIFAFVIIAEIAFNAAYMGIYVVHSSMSPTLTGADDETIPGGDYIYVDKRVQPDYGDIVVVFVDEPVVDDFTGLVLLGKGNIIKRAIAFAGDTVKIESGKLFIKYSGTEDFTAIDEPYVAETNNTVVGNFGEYTVKDGEMFLLGDNRNVSLDSRMNGGTGFPLKNLVGVAPQWAVSLKGLSTATYTFFHFTLPKAFGIID